MKSRSLKIAGFTLVVCCLPACGAGETDTGYIFAGPEVIEQTVSMKDGSALILNHRKGVMVTNDVDSPFFRATYLNQMFTVKDADGKVVQEAALIEAIDPEGNVAWATLWHPAGEPAILRFVHGLGKWQGITGSGELSGMLQKRADDHIMPTWKISWSVDPDPDPSILSDFPEDDSFTGHDLTYSFHGPHATKFSQTLATGYILDANTQAGICVSDNPDSPLYQTAWKSQDTSIKDLGGKTLADVLLIIRVDPYGNAIFTLMTWWYETGLGEYYLVGGIGKWKGIVGERKVIGMEVHRLDDHFILNEQSRWKMPKK